MAKGKTNMNFGLQNLSFKGTTPAPEVSQNSQSVRQGYLDRVNSVAAIRENMQNIANNNKEVGQKLNVIA